MRSDLRTHMSCITFRSADQHVELVLKDWEEELLPCIPACWFVIAVVLIVFNLSTLAHIN